MIDTLVELAEKHTIDEAVDYFTDKDFSKREKRPIKTIATSYHRCYMGGVERAHAQLMTLWISMGYKVVLLTVEEANPLDFPYPKEVKRIVIPRTGDLRARLLAIQTICIDESVDIYINHEWTNDAILWEGALLKSLGIAHCVYAHGHFTWNVRQRITTINETRIFSFCDLMIALSETNARFYQMAGCQSYLVQNPIPEDLIENKEISLLDNKHILFVGRLASEKNPMHALEIFKEVHDKIPEAVLDLVGADEDNFTPKINDFVANNNLTDAIISHGAKSEVELKEFYKHSACFLFTSSLEGYPMVLLEAKSYGLPIVMYELPYLTLTKGKKGILTSDFGQIGQMAQHIITIFENQELRRQLGTESREDFERFAQYDLKQIWQDIFSVIESGEAHLNDNLYLPSNLSPSDRCIIPGLIEAIELGCKNTRDYKLGQKILKLPRLINKWRSKLLKHR